MSSFSSLTHAHASPTEDNKATTDISAIEKVTTNISAIELEEQIKEIIQKNT